MSSSAEFTIVAVQLAVLIFGTMLLWRLGLSARARRIAPALGAWDVSVADFFFFIWFVVAGGCIGPALMGLWFKRHPFDTDVRVILSTAVFQLGMFGGVLAYHLGFRRRPESPAEHGGRPVLAGVATYLISLPVVLVVSLVWIGLLKLCQVATPQQEAIDILRNTGNTLPLTVLLACALVIAPVTEELIFRAGIFRYARTRLPRWAALLLPASLFGAMHANLASFAPLVALGVVYSLAYERTGRITTTIVAHSLFNATTTVLVLAGLDV
ncbi:MAG: Abortive infection protein [Verrucomicrobia bacterium]|nr:Abortive infection protein [Verrucomicrobiota bacterium]